MQPIHITLNGCPRSKKNSMQIVRHGNYSSLIPSKPYREYAKLCHAQIDDKLRKRIDIPCCVKGVYFMETHRKVDLGNLINATLDILVAEKVLLDDNCEIVVHHDGSRVYYDKECPRAEIDIIPIARDVE